MNFEEILSHFKVMHRGQATARCICPSHNDKEPSLTISMGAKGIVLHCHAGCSTEDILSAVGLKMSDLFDDGEKPAVADGWRDYVEAREGRKIEGAYHYCDRAGSYSFTRIRLSGKQFLYGILKGGRFTYGLGGKSRKSVPAMYCRNWALFRDAVSKGGQVFYVEGEKDVDSMTKRGFSAVTCGGSGDWSSSCIDFFTGADVVVVADNDDPGRKSAQAVAGDLVSVAKSVRIVLPTPDLEHGDVSDYLAGHGDDELQALIDAASVISKDAIEPAASTAINSVSADELLRMDIAPVEFLVPGLIPKTGAAGVVAKPKIGKSWFVLDLCISVATGSSFLGRQCQRAGALYLSLEDSYSRLQDRLRKVLGGRQVPPGLSVAIECRNLDAGLIDDLEAYRRENADVGLIVIDTLQKVRGQQRRSESIYAFDSREIGLLKSFADKAGVAVVLVHHTRKSEDLDDPFADISGSNGILGILDTCLVITKDKRTDTGAKLWTIGRDVDMDAFEIRFDKGDCRWHMVGQADEVEEARQREAFERDPVVITVKRLLEQNHNRWEGTTAELMQAGRYIARRALAVNEVQLGKKLSQYAPLFYPYALIEYSTVKSSKNGNRLHRFEISDPFEADCCGDNI